MIKIAVKYEDYEIVEKIFIIRNEADGVMATQYSLDLFEIYKQKAHCFLSTLRIDSLKENLVSFYQFG